MRLDSVELALDALRSEHTRLQRHARLLENRLDELQDRPQLRPEPGVAGPRLPRFEAGDELEDVEPADADDEPPIIQQNSRLFWWVALAIALFAGAATFALVRPQVLFQL